MVEEVIISISLIIVLAAALTIIARIIRQPPILAYLFAGVLAGPLFFGYLSADTSSIIQLMSRIGVAFLLFIVGLSLDYRLFKEIGKVSVLAGIFEVFVVGALGFLLAFKLGFANLASIYIGAALAFSSTVVVVKILSDKNILSHKLLGAGNGGYFLIFTQKGLGDHIFSSYNHTYKIHISEQGLKTTNLYEY